jgi:hypothetical protein
VSNNEDRVVPLLRLGDWEVFLHACTPKAEAPVQRFCDFSRAFLAQSANPGEGVRHLVVASQAVLSEQIHPTWLLESDRPAWAKFYKGWTTAYRHFCQARSLDSPQAVGPTDRFAFSWPRPGYEGTDSRSPSAEREQPGPFFALVIEEPDEHSYLTIYGYSLFLATRWHVERGGLCLHSAAVARGRDGFLFLGASEAGKTSVARLSASAGRPALGDDLNFVIRDEENGYLLAAAPSPQLSPVGYSPFRPRLRGVFTLVKDGKERLVPMSPMLTARALFDAFTQAPPARRLPDEVIGLAFRTVCDIARRVPGYELHLRNSPDFWRLIDERFPD